MYIVSQCLMGIETRYDAGANLVPEVVEYLKGKSVCLICPEHAGGLPTPRPPAEYRGNIIINKVGENVTEAFEEGAQLELRKALDMAESLGESIELAICKSRSPSCGAGSIYDGNFNGIKVPGDGCFVKLLKEYGIPVITEEEIINIVRAK